MQSWPNPIQTSPTVGTPYMGPLYDPRLREGFNPSNSAVAANTLFNTGNPLIDMAGNFATQALYPGGIRPMNGMAGLGASGYMDAVARFQLLQSPAAQAAIASNVPMSSALTQWVGQDQIRSSIVQQFGPGGNSAAAFNMAFSRLAPTTPMMGANGAPMDQIGSTQAIMSQMMGGMKTQTGWNYNASFGLGQDDLINWTDSMSRYGMGGLNRDSFAQTALRGQLGGLTKSIAKTAGMARATFGEDMTPDQVGDLLDRASGGIETLMDKAGKGMGEISESKVQDFLAKVQATSKAVDMSARGFAEYMAMMQNIYKSMGVGGATSSTAIMSAALEGKSAGSNLSSMGIMSQSQAMNATQQNRLDWETSSSAKQLDAVAALMGSDGAGIQLNSGRTLGAAHAEMVRNAENGNATANAGIWQDVMNSRVRGLSASTISTLGMERTAFVDRESAGSRDGINGSASRMVSDLPKLMAAENPDLINKVGGQKRYKQILDEVGAGVLSVPALTRALGGDENTARALAASASAIGTRQGMGQDRFAAALETGGEKGRRQGLIDQAGVEASIFSESTILGQSGEFFRKMNPEDYLPLIEKLSANPPDSIDDVISMAKDAVNITLKPREAKGLAEAARVSGAGASAYKDAFKESINKGGTRDQAKSAAESAREAVFQVNHFDPSRTDASGSEIDGFRNAIETKSRIPESERMKASDDPGARVAEKTLTETEKQTELLQKIEGWMAQQAGVPKGEDLGYKTDRTAPAAAGDMFV